MKKVVAWFILIVMSGFMGWILADAIISHDAGLETELEEVKGELNDLKKVNMEAENEELVVEMTDKKVNKEAYYIRNEIMWHNEEISLEQAAYKAAWYYNMAEKYDIHPYLAVAVGIEESHTKHVDSEGEVIMSNKGAIGEMQLMPKTARIYDVNPLEVEQNIEGGVRYLSELIDGYGGEVETALAHYNGGSNPYYKIVEYKETKEFTEDVMNIYTSMKEKYGSES